MFSGSKPNYLKLRTNLRLCINRLKLLEKKKTELALKARKEIADYISAGKEDRARIRVEHIVREDYMVEAMEIVEMFCDLILARYGMIERMKELDPGLEEAIATIIWVTLRLVADVPELKEVTKQFTIKYGKEYAEMCRTNGFENVNEKVMHKLSVAAPPKMLIENYLVEIAKTYKVDFDPDMSALLENDAQEASDLIDIDPDEKRRPPGGGSGGGGGGRMMGFEGLGGPPQAPGPGALYGASGGMGHPDQGFPQVPGSGVFPDTEPPPKAIPPYQPSGSLPARPPSYTDQGRGPQGQGPPYLPNHPPNAGCNRGLPPPVLPPGGASGGWQTHQNGGISGSDGAPLPTYTDVMYTPPAQQPNAPPGSSLGLPDLPDVPGLPSVPSSTLGMGSAGGEDVDFDDLTKRFEQLKKHK